MTREEFEAALWATTCRQLSGAQIDAIMHAADAYIAEHIPHRRIAHFRHSSDRDLYPVIGVLADALLNQSEPI